MGSILPPSRLLTHPPAFSFLRGQASSCYSSAPSALSPPPSARGARGWTAGSCNHGLGKGRDCLGRVRTMASCRALGPMASGHFKLWPHLWSVLTHMAWNSALGRGLKHCPGDAKGDLWKPTGVLLRSKWYPEKRLTFSQLSIPFFPHICPISVNTPG